MSKLEIGAGLLAIIELLSKLPVWIVITLLTCIFACGRTYIVVNGEHSAEVITALKN